MITHELRCWPIYYKRLRDGTKNFEIRENDRDFQTGDRTKIMEWDKNTEKYTKAKPLYFLITYIGSTLAPADPHKNYVVLSLKKVKP